jgi:tetratricopeptide (TPR) repeat protein
MKNITYILIVVVSLMFSACDNYLDIKPKGQIILKEVSEYNGFFNDESFLHGDYFARTPIMTTDEGCPYNKQKIIDNPNSINAANFLWNKNVDRVSLTLEDEFYNRAYKRISRYNIIIEEVLDAEGNEADKKEVYAKAKVLRAFNHFLLVNYYAKHYDKNTATTDNGIIVIKTFDMEQNPVQTSVQDAYDFILKDINDVLSDLKEKTENNLHPSKAFAYALLAKVHLFMKEFDKAKEAVEKSLAINSYVYDLVDAHNRSTPGGFVPSLPKTDYNLPEFLYYAGGPWGDPILSRISRIAINRFGTGDIRLDDFYASHPRFPNVTFKFWFQRNYKHVGAGITVPEVLLMKAECLARGGDASGAMSIVNDLREKRVLSDYALPTEVTAKEAVNIVINERARELVNTLNRFFDIRRLADEADYKIALSREFNGKTYNVDPATSHIFIMPFPKTATDKNPHLKQNTK